MTEHLPSKCRALSSIPSTDREVTEVASCGMVHACNLFLRRKIDS
jgi:hypothetical protein